VSHRPLRRAMVAGAFAVCLALTPGTAWAEEDPAAPALPAEVTDVLEGQQSEGEQPVEDEEAAADETPEPPAFEIPPEVIAAFEQLAAEAGISEECVNGVAASIEQIGNGIAGLPAELEGLATDLGAAIQESIDTQSPTPIEDFLGGLNPAPEDPEGPPTPPIGGDITAGLEQLAEVLQSEACQPAPPAPPAPPANNPQQPPAVHQPPQPPAAPAPQAPVQPAVYPGYAPNGAEQADEGPSPVALGIATAFLAGSGVWASRRWRAAHR
jgi:hypothetical protein